MASSSEALWVAFWGTFHEVLAGDALKVAPVCRIKGRRHVRLNPGTALAFAAECYDCQIEDLLGASKVQYLIEARALVVWALRNSGQAWSYPQIGRVLGGRDHTTAMNLARRATALREQSPQFRGACDDLVGLLLKSEKETEHASH